jgi:large subunit ribosomal protein L19e
MKLDRKKQLATRTLGVGKNRIVFNNQRLEEIKEAITKQDIRDLVAAGAIKVKEVGGRKAKKERKTRRRAGSIRKKVRERKREYVKFVRKLRSYISELRKHGKLSNSEFFELRKHIRNRTVKNKAGLKERIAEMKSS